MTAVSSVTGTVPLVVDVDGTLIRTDLLHETTLQFMARHPYEVFRLLPWLARGRNALKCELAARVDLDVASLPLRDETVALIREAQTERRPVYLASASERGLVERLAERVGGVAGVFATDHATNVAGAHKSAQLNAAFGTGQYDYVGDRPVDFGVWPSARRVYAVAHTPGFARRVLGLYPDAAIIAEPQVARRDMIRALRPHQWAKNLLVFLTLVAGHHLDWSDIRASVLAFACFCLAASSAYIANDLLDLPGDRAHPRKRHRPFASGAVPITHGVVLSAALMAAALATTLLLPWRFALVLVGYVALTLAYSLVLKRKLLVDVIVLAGLYTIRVLGGVAAAQQGTSRWLLMFSLFLFLSLATVKRCSELVARIQANKPAPPGRGYRPGDLAVLFPLTAAAGYSAVLVVALYLASPEVVPLYTHPTRMWLMCPLLLYWISRVLVLSSRNELHDDPVIFALTDRISWLTGLVAAAIIAVSM